MKITLVFPREPLTEDFIKTNTYPLYPIGILYVASYLHEHGYDCNIIDTTFSNWEDFEKKIKEENPDIVGFSISTPSALSGFKAISIVKKIMPKAITVIGGPHGCVDPINSIKNPNVDYVVLGEGEITFYKLVDAINDGHDIKEIKGLLYKDNGNIVQTGPPEAIEDLDSLPFPNRDLIDIKKYLKSTTMSVSMGRGCPFNCIFCQPISRKMFGLKARMISVEKTVNEMEWLAKKYDFRKFNVLDDTFTYDKGYVLKFCKLLIERKINKKWNCQSRVDTIDEDMLKEMHKAGCEIISYGVESGSQRILDFLRKGITVEQTKNAFRITHKHNILTHAYLMLGTPTETKEDVDMTLNLIKDIHPDFISIGITTPMLGSDLYEYCNKNGISNIKELEDYNYYDNAYPIRLDNLTEEDLKSYHALIVRTWRRSMIKNLIKYIRMFVTSKDKMFYIHSAYAVILGKFYYSGKFHFQTKS